MFNNCYQNKRVLVTGHTGFKGAWLAEWLLALGADVTGFALPPPTTPSLFEQLGLASRLRHVVGDVRDLEAVRRAVEETKPDFVFHLAAQPLVRLSYEQPVETYATNVMGTVNVLEAVRLAARPCVVVAVTTDKCYENKEWVHSYREEDPMGGYDPYSSSKGAAELVIAAYRRSYFSAPDSPVKLASARAGNVIGGGDWATDRLVPDILRAFERNEPVIIRNPHSTRPWQHVLEPLSGYLALAQRLWDEGAAFAEGWNLGPRDEDAKPVQWIVERLVDLWGHGARWQLDGGTHPHEAHYLKLDISKARSRLGWQPAWRLADALQHIVAWHQAWLAKQDVRALCLQQIAQYTHDSNTIAP